MQTSIKGPIATLRAPEGVRKIHQLFAAGRMISGESGILPGELCVTVRRRMASGGITFPVPRHEEIILAVDLDYLRSLRKSR